MALAMGPPKRHRRSATAPAVLDSKLEIARYDFGRSFVGS